MASGTADLQDLGGAIMQSILGALLAAGYAAAVSTAISDAPNRQEITDSVQKQLVKSFSSAEATAEQYPQYAEAITAAAKTSFIDGADWAYVAGIIAILIGATLVYLLFPKKDAEQQLLTKYHAEDSQRARARMSASAAPPVGREDTGLGTS
jgi:MFS transporter, DHA2 family, multidrug resistance protein